ncbi:MAG: TonB family protein [Deltaproteobacteria bacterium]|nr:TonB family protein [Deltaproteobacteria bacterium]
MYLSYYNLKIKPFQISSDPKFLWLGEKHKEALAMLKYASLENKEFFLLTGDVGTGKTTLINALVNSLGKEMIIAKVSYPGLNTLEFFNFIANEFKMNKIFSDKGEFLVHLDNFLNNVYKNNKKVLVIIDEAQCLKHELLNDIRLLTNIERQDTKLINLFFVGNNEFNDILLDTANSNLRQRITIRYHLDALAKNEIAEYVGYRLKIAGSEQDIFTSGAIRQIFSFSGGCPRLINIICDHALLTGYARGKKTIDAGILKGCAEALRITTQRKNKGIDLKFVKTIGKKLTGILKGRAEEPRIATKSRKKKSIDLEFVKTIGKKLKERRPILYIAFFVIALIIVGYFNKEFLVGYFNKGFLSQDTVTTKEIESDSSFQTVKTNKNELPAAGDSGVSDKIKQQDVSAPSHTATAQNGKEALSVKRSIPRLRYAPEPVPQLQEIKDLKVTQLISGLKPIKLEPVETDRPDRLLENMTMPDIPDVSGPDISDWVSDKHVVFGDYATAERYMEMVRLRIERHKIYPRNARVRQVEGEATVRFIITPEGDVRAVEVVKTSGDKSLDRAAFAAVKDAAPFPRASERLFKGEIPLELILGFELK